MIKKMFINAVDPEESRVVIVEDGVLVDLDIETSVKGRIKGNIYKGIVARVEPGFEAAFVYYGGNRSGFLPFSEVHPKYYPERAGGERGRSRIQDVLKKNQEILVQVVKEEIGTKGAALSTYISLAGRYLVLMPGVENTGVSRKIENEAERNRLKEIVAQLNPPPGMGLIIRTAGLERNKAELSRDLTYLLRLWETICATCEEKPAPALIYQEDDPVLRSIRDYFTTDIKEVVIDNADVYKKAKEYFKTILPLYQRRVKLYREKRPLFLKHQIEEQIEAIYERKVPLKSGGSIVIDATEAMVAIDVNSGRAHQEKGIEETAFKANLEAAEEIARQLKLRDLGGLIVVDFIDMKDRKHCREVEKCLRNAVKIDKARFEFSRISKFGLLEFSRQRIKQEIKSGSFVVCETCSGSGTIKSTEASAVSILRKIQAAASKSDLAMVKGTLPSKITLYLLNHKRESLYQLEKENNLVIRLFEHADPAINRYELEFIKKEEPSPPLSVPPLEEKDVTEREEETGQVDVKAEEAVEEEVEKDQVKVERKGRGRRRRWRGRRKSTENGNLKSEEQETPSELVTQGEEFLEVFADEGILEGWVELKNLTEEKEETDSI